MPRNRWAERCNTVGVEQVDGLAGTEKIQEATHNSFVPDGTGDVSKPSNLAVNGWACFTRSLRVPMRRFQSPTREHGFDVVQQ